VQIYDIIQNKKSNYWIATNEGLYYYDHYHYQNINLPEAKSKSVFGFAIDERTGRIYCHNLNKQVFRIDGLKCSILYELKEGESSPDMSLAVAGNGDLVISAKLIIVLDRNGNVRLRRDAGPRYLAPSYVSGNGEVLIYQNDGENILSYSKGKLVTKKIRTATGGRQPGNLKFFSIRDSCYAVEMNTGLYYHVDISRGILTSLPKQTIQAGRAIRVYETKEGAWQAGALPGVVLFRGRAGDNREVLYKDYFISNVFQDDEGNILLSTFGRGILVIPDMNIPDAITTFRDDPVTAICADPRSGKLLLGTSKGRLLQYSGGGLSTIDNKGNKSIEGLYSNAERDLVLYDNGAVNALTKENRIIRGIATSSLKDAAVVSQEECYLATNIGVSHVRLKHGAGFEINNLPGVNSRAYLIEADEKDRNIYSYTSDGLFMLALGGVNSSIQHKGEAIIANGMCCANGKTYVSTPSSGILVVQGTAVISAIRPEINEEMRKLAIYKNTLVGQTRNGLYQFDMNGRLLRQLHIDYRFPEKKVIDFSFSGDTLWLCHSAGVQRIDITYQPFSAGQPVIRIDSLRVNGKYAGLIADGSFGSQMRKFEFTISSPTLRDREYTFYQYRLRGYDNEWKIQAYEENHIVYNALAPGSYTLDIKASRRGKDSDIISYSFSISRPFYLRWYFWLACAAVFILLVFAIYKWQLGIQKRRSQQINELNASRLTAIRSQMNPHFIFNSLNSIQDLVLKGDVERSYSYITTFSDLIRRSLNYSGKDLIDFEQELRLIELYLSLEKLRFKKDFSYEIDASQVTDIQVPPMLIQPFIENAIVHGLLHKEGDKKLSITFSLADALICRIEDNGVGREKAQAILQRQRAGHESFSGEAIKKRFEILSVVFDGKYGYEYEDKENGAGTIVELRIPALPGY
jgi:hypothetical protein